MDAVGASQWQLRNPTPTSVEHTTRIAYPSSHRVELHFPFLSQLKLLLISRDAFSNCVRRDRQVYISTSLSLHEFSTYEGRSDIYIGRDGRRFRAFPQPLIHPHYRQWRHGRPCRSCPSDREPQYSRRYPRGRSCGFR